MNRVLIAVALTFTVILVGCWIRDIALAVKLP